MTTHLTNLVQFPDRSSLRVRVAEEVRAELARKKISVNKLPRLLGKSQSFWSRRVNGDQAFDMDDLEMVAGLLGVRPQKFLGAEEGPDSPPPSGLQHKSGD